jgi:radical SAM superfamily enzyme YgiQ (UPF0313 family)
MRVCLIQPPQIEALDEKLNPSISLLTIASPAIASGHDLQYCELSGIRGTPDELRTTMADTIPHADVYGVTFYTAAYHVVQLIVEVCKQKNPESTVCVGGYHPSACPDETIAMENIDVVFVGEADLAFADWLNKGAPSAGIIYCSALNEESLNLTPFPADHLADFSRYTRTIDGRRCYDLFSTRGCAWNCSFCAKSVCGKGVRFYSNHYMEGYLKKIRPSVSNLMFLDDVFTLRRDTRLRQLLRIIKENGFTFRCNCKPTHDQPEDFVLLKEAGCLMVGTGSESGSDKILKLMNKGCTVKHNTDTIQWAKDAGICVKSYLMFGFPGENEETVHETLEWIDKVDPDQFTLFTFTAFPGTDVYNHPEKYGVTWISDDWNEYQMVRGHGLGNYNIETKFMTREKAIELNKLMLTELVKRPQRGAIQSYYEKFDVSKIGTI